MDLRVFEEKVMVFKGYLMSYLMNIWWKYAEFWAQLWVVRALASKLLKNIQFYPLKSYFFILTYQFTTHPPSQFLFYYTTY